MGWHLLGADAALTGLLMFTVLGLFFMLYISRVETQSYESQVTDQINAHLGKVLDAANAQSHGKLKALFQQFPYDRVQKALSVAQARESATEVNNRWLFIAISVTNVVLFVAYILYIVVSRQLGATFSVPRHIFETVGVISLVGLVEYLFFTQIASKYVPTLPSTMIDELVTSLRNW